MADVFSFYLEILSSFFTFLSGCVLFSGLSLLQFIVAFIVLFIIVDNFIIKPAKGSSVSFHRKGSKGGK